MILTKETFEQLYVTPGPNLSGLLPLYALLHVAVTARSSTSGVGEALAARAKVARVRMRENESMMIEAADREVSLAGTGCGSASLKLENLNVHSLPFICFGDPDTRKAPGKIIRGADA
jgi:hypothetical protein